MNFRLKFIRWLFPSIVGIFALWTIGGNLLADYLEKDIKQEIEEYAKQFPYKEPNDSALKLEAILAKKMGIGVFGVSRYQGVYKIATYTSHSDFDVSKSANNDFENIQEKLTQYLDAQNAKPNDQIDAPPVELQRYLASQTDGLAAIKDHILNNQVPQWEQMDFLVADYDVALPSSLGLANLQKIMALDILEKTRLGKDREALEMLEVSWKINKSLSNSYTLIGQLVALIIVNYQAGVIRKLDNIPPEWQQRFLEHDYRQSVLKSIEGEYIMQFNFVKLIFNNKMDTSFWEDWYEEDKLIYLVLRLDLLTRPYIRFSAIDSYHVGKEALAHLPTQNVCLSTKTPDINQAWWNINPILISFFNQELKAAKYMLELEFSQKILQVKEIAAKQGKWPDSLPKMESSFCPGYRWVYQVSEEGEMSISLNEKPDWAKDRTLPLTYRDKTIPKSPKK
ncbi:MAG: hypothetical protein WBA93_02480 [Microcoleaceae cyanobacterium]